MAHKLKLFIGSSDNTAPGLLLELDSHDCTPRLNAKCFGWFVGPDLSAQTKKPLFIIMEADLFLQCSDLVLETSQHCRRRENDRTAIIPSLISLAIAVYIDCTVSKGVRAISISSSSIGLGS